MRKTLVSLLTATFLAAAASGKETPRPAAFFVLGGSYSTPFGRGAHADFGKRIGLGLGGSLRAGELRLPLEWGLSLRVASLAFDGWFERDEFTDLQMPFIFHGPESGLFQILALWVPSYTLDMVSVSSFAGRVSGREGLRTRFNMGFGAGLQLSVPPGFRLRGHWVYNLFSPYPASRLTWGDAGLDLAWPLVFRRSKAP